MMPFFFLIFIFCKVISHFYLTYPLWKEGGSHSTCLRANVQVGGWLQPHAAVAAGVWRAAAVADVCRRRVKSHALNDVKLHMTSTFI